MLSQVWESEESHLKEQTHQQRQMEEAVEKLLQKEEDEKKDTEKEYLGTSIIPEPSVQSSDYLGIMIVYRSFRGIVAVSYVIVML